MNVVKPKRIREYQAKHGPARTSLETWLTTAKRARWKTLADVRASFNGTDEVRVASGKRVLIFNIAGNRFRLLVAAHFNRGNLFVLRFLTHAEYSKNQWKNEL